MKRFSRWLRTLLTPAPAHRKRGFAGLVFLALPLCAAAAAPVTVPADYPAIRFSDYVEKELTPDGAVRFQRILDVPGRGYRWDNPGARVRFRTDARAIAVRLRYSDKHTSPSARAPVGIFLIDGRSDPAWTFSSRTRETLRAVEDISLELPVPAAGFHDYTVVLPYGDSVDFLGLNVNEGAAFAPPADRPALRYVAYGDSVTHGFTASHIGHTYPYRLAEARAWQLVNLGFGGRTARAPEGDVVGRLGGDIVTILIGVNDWQGGVAPDIYRQAMRGLLTRIRALQPGVPVYAITPLWVSEKWKPAKARFPLEDYRAALRALVAELHDPALHLIEGPGLIDADERFFDAVLVHPNDAGFAQMAERLSRQIAPVAPR